MKTFRLIPLILGFVILYPIFYFGNAAENHDKYPCPEDTLECLRDNIYKLSEEKYSLFWEKLNIAASKAQKCNSVEDTIAFLKLTKLINGGAELSEFFSEIIEHLCIENPKCLFDGLLMLDKPTRVLLIGILKTPTFTDKSKIDQIFLKVKTDKKYQEISDIYFFRK